MPAHSLRPYAADKQVQSAGLKSLIMRAQQKGWEILFYFGITGRFLRRLTVTNNNP